MVLYVMHSINKNNDHGTMYYSTARYCTVLQKPTTVQCGTVLQKAHSKELSSKRHSTRST